MAIKTSVTDPTLTIINADLNHGDTCLLEIVNKKGSYLNVINTFRFPLSVLKNKSCTYFPEKLTNPAFETVIEVGFLKRAGSNSSLNSLMSPEGEPHIRTCQNCRKLLERRDQQIEQRTSKPPIVHMYEVIYSRDYLLKKICRSLYPTNKFD